jgi:hypothetical protein
MVLRWGYYLQNRRVGSIIFYPECYGNTKIHAGIHKKLSLNKKWWIWRYGTCIKISQKCIFQYFSFIYQHISRIFRGKRVRRHLAELIYTRKEVTFCQEYRIRVFKVTVKNSLDNYIFLFHHKPDWFLREIPRIGRFWPHQNWWHLSPRQNSVTRAELLSSETIWGTYQKVAVVKRRGR